MGSVFELKLHQASDWTAFERNQLHALVSRLSTHSAQDIAFGVSDGGDPWCAILDDSDDVILHVARIRGRFVVHAAQENAVAEARDLWSAVTTAAGEPSPRDDRLPEHIFAAMAVEDVHEAASVPLRADEAAFTPLHPLAASTLIDDDKTGAADDHARPAFGELSNPVVTGLSFEPLIATTGMAGAGDPPVPPHVPVAAEPVTAIRPEPVAPTPEAVVAHVTLSPYAGAEMVAAHPHDAAPPSPNPFLIDGEAMPTPTGDEAGGDNVFRPALDRAAHPNTAAANPNVLLVGGWLPSDTGHPTFGVVAEVVGGRSGLMQSPPGAHIDFIAIGAEGATSVSSSQPVLSVDGKGLNVVTGQGSTLFHAPPEPANDLVPVSLDHLPMEPAIQSATGVWAAPDPLHG